MCHPSPVHNPIALSTVAVLGSHPHCLFPELSFALFFLLHFGHKKQWLLWLLSMFLLIFILTWKHMSFWCHPSSVGKTPVMVYSSAGEAFLICAWLHNKAGVRRGFFMTAFPFPVLRCWCVLFRLHSVSDEVSTGTFVFGPLYSWNLGILKELYTVQ